ncbi:hypothetical protein [Nocardiopsis suaedae]|uniref:Uncharacterized protein n=1 Tax=Nocardiopsis suaedae TaxID=3018444 RepID=A0ABT4TM15_9ACTN|nr:hypothetical protein [Nocardiopsis suaedae]MDA2805416.1 hypothetical protein [Nocardiopsis suaedae]
MAETFLAFLAVSALVIMPPEQDTALTIRERWPPGAGEASLRR